MEWVLAVCVALLGSDDFETREFGQLVVEQVLFTFDCTGPLRKAAVEHDDPEVRRRCRDALDKYTAVGLPSQLWMTDFRPGSDPARWAAANALPHRQDMAAYVAMCFEAGMTRAEVLGLVEHASRVRRANEIAQWQTKVRWQAWGWVEKGMKPFLPPPPEPGEFPPDFPFEE